MHKICAAHQVSRSALKAWIRIYRKGGYEALRTIKPQGTGRKGMGRPKKQEPQTELERLRYENEYLRAEVALLKKVRALMKNELLYNNRWESIEDFKVAQKEYIRYYNNERIKLKLKMSPVQYRTHFQTQVK